MAVMLKRKKEQAEEFPKFLTMDEAARYMRTSYRIIRRLIEAGAIPCAVLGGRKRLISREVLDRFVANGGKVED